MQVVHDAVKADQPLHDSVGLTAESPPTQPEPTRA
ncbi:hypothetical protein PF005_g13955 [Phytophthora fragariae]|uniref:Uncharacterized protein n=1 Tax=Phytophthora fragariae TaxID=53985 RepID=A0A6A3TQB1_9STRA|nr:hypothetical protein PF003_g26109 [Phytophthora fragariae]KAE9016480.1 hypothetical protein PF011_g7139 [Phytophthora fragariae]KAE9105055.1 hypothetical protein PF007_g13839 [Phytophthora fragariae]KAE9141442.1 hypothetical protein PF006_g13196 [Phytophthora fragariae]KAE9204010.1 hypothetical protein PF005_g13955 [Phytophthora fragariae]